MLTALTFLSTGCGPEEIDDPGNTNIVTPAPDDVLLNNKEALESGDLTAAQSSISAALVSYPNDPTLNFYNALLVWINIVGDTELNTFLTELGFSQLPTSFDDLASKLRAGLEPNYDFLIFPEFPDMEGIMVSDVQDILDTEILTRINTALNSLTVTKADNNFNLVLNVESILTNLGLDSNAMDISTYSIEFDEADILMYDGVLSGVGGILNIFLAWDLDLDIDKVMTMMSNMEMMEGETNFDWWYNPFADTSYNFGELTANGTTHFANAKTLLIRAAQDAENGVTALLAETDDQSDDVIPQPEEEDDFDVEEIQAITGPLLTSLQGTAIDMGITNTYYIDESTDGLSYMGLNNVNLGAFFDSAPALRDLLFEMDASGEPVFYNMDGVADDNLTNGEPFQVKMNDLTFGGLFEGGFEMTQIDITESRSTNFTIPEFFEVSGYNTALPDSLQAIMGIMGAFMGEESMGTD